MRIPFDRVFTHADVDVKWAARYERFMSKLTPKRTRHSKRASEDTAVMREDSQMDFAAAPRACAAECVPEFFNIAIKRLDNYDIF